MAKRSRGAGDGKPSADGPRSAAEIVKEEMPDYRIVKSRRATPAATRSLELPEAGRADAISASLEALRRQYRVVEPPAADVDVPAAATGRRAVSGGSPAEVGDEGEVEAGDVEILTVVPKDADADPGTRQGPGPKSVVVSKSRGRIIGSQG